MAIQRTSFERAYNQLIRNITDYGRKAVNPIRNRVESWFMNHPPTDFEMKVGTKIAGAIRTSVNFFLNPYGRLQPNQVFAFQRRSLVTERSLLNYSFLLGRTDREKPMYDLTVTNDCETEGEVTQLTSYLRDRIGDIDAYLDDAKSFDSLTPDSKEMITREGKNLQKKLATMNFQVMVGEIAVWDGIGPDWSTQRAIVSKLIENYWVENARLANRVAGEAIKLRKKIGTEQPPDDLVGGEITPENVKDTLNWLENLKLMRKNRNN